MRLKNAAPGRSVMPQHSQPFKENLSRRRFMLLTSAALSVANGFRSQPAGLTASQVIERIQMQVHVPWRSRTVDTFKAGNPDTVVKGIATSFSATLDVCQRAAASGKNLIIVHEPTFYNHLDENQGSKRRDLSHQTLFHRRAQPGGLAIPRSLARPQTRRHPGRNG